MFRKIVSSVGSLLLVIGLLGFAPAPEGLAVQEAPGVGEEDLFNFEHVYNFNFAEHTDSLGQGGSTSQQGTDVEFFSIPDATGGELDFAVVGDHSNGVFLFDITDPARTELASYITCPNPRNDVGVKQFTDSDGVLRTLIGLSREGGSVCFEAGPSAGPEMGGGVAMFDVTDPYDPQPFARVQVDTGGAHNFMFHPTEPVAYVWNGELARLGAYSGVYDSSIQLIDMRPAIDPSHSSYTGDPADMFRLIGPTTLGSVHDGELSPDGTTMYVASENNYEIFDNSDPFNPVRIGDYVPNPGTYAHGYFPTPDGNISVTNNESLALGGFFAGGSTVCPGEGLGFYDTSDPAAVVGPIGYYVPPVYGSPNANDNTLESRACTSHFGRVVDNGVVMTVGWYILGGRVVDFSDPTLPVEIGAATLEPEGTPFDEGTEAWAAKTYKGKPYMFVGDQGRGFDVFAWAGDPACGNPFGSQVGAPGEGDEDTYVPGCIDGRGPVDPQNARSPLAVSLAAASLALSRDDVEFAYSCQL